jgi:murein DD-endopeptidase MepM/ murein hydrolase activator NlpD
MTQTLPRWSALVVCFLLLFVAAPAPARSDGSARLQIVWPADGTVTGRFGEWRGGHRHVGIDIGMLRSLRLRAAGPGVVQAAGYLAGYEGYGQVVLLDLQGPYTALYAHLSEVGVSPGQRLVRGQELGLAGCTGSCSGTHLHFEVHHHGEPVNPMRFLG